MSARDELARRIREAQQRNLPSPYVADRERMLQDRVAFQAIVRQLAANRYARREVHAPTVEVVA